MRRFSGVTLPAVLLAAGFSVSSLPSAQAAMDRLLPSGDGLRAPSSAAERLAESAEAIAPVLQPPAPAAPEKAPETAEAAEQLLPETESTAKPERARIALKPRIGGAPEEETPSQSRAVADALGSVYSLTLSLVDSETAAEPAPVLKAPETRPALPAFRLAEGDALRIPGKEAPVSRKTAPQQMAEAAPPAPAEPAKAASAEESLPSLPPQAATPVESAALTPADPLPQPEAAEETVVAEAAPVEVPASETTAPEAREAGNAAEGQQIAEAAAETTEAAPSTPPVQEGVIEGAPSAPLRTASTTEPARGDALPAALVPSPVLEEADKKLTANLPPPPDPALEPAAVYAGDFTGDGHADRLVFWREAESKAAFADRAPSIYASDGQGALQPRNFFAHDGFPEQPAHVRVADFNGDGRDDVFIASAKAGGEKLQIWLSGADGLLHNASEKALPDHEPWQSPRWQVWAVALGDVDANGHMDILVGTQPLFVDFMEEQSVVRLFVNDGAGLFYDASDALPQRLRDPALIASAPERLAHIGLKDMNDDEADDLLAYLPGDNKHVVFLNAGFGDFTRSDPLPARYFAKRERPGKTGAIASLAGQNPFLKK